VIPTPSSPACGLEKGSNNAQTETVHAMVMDDKGDSPVMIQKQS
jgi:hypothetical protein